MPWGPAEIDRGFAGDRFMLQPGSCLPELLDQLAANNVYEYNTGGCSGTNGGRGDRRNLEIPKL
jgi:hypothetical protein